MPQPLATTNYPSRRASYSPLPRPSGSRAPGVSRHSVALESFVLGTSEPHMTHQGQMATKQATGPTWRNIPVKFPNFNAGRSPSSWPAGGGRPQADVDPFGQRSGNHPPPLDFELELIKFHMTQTLMQRGEVDARALSVQIRSWVGGSGKRGK